MDIKDFFASRFAKGENITVLTAYDAFTTRLCLETDIDCILVGDSLGNVIQGLTSTRNVHLEDMIYHTRIVAGLASGKKPVVADLSAGSYDTPEDCLEASRKLVEAGADAVKFEGNFPDEIRILSDNGIAFMGHVGLLPQTAEKMKVQGRDSDEAQKILEDSISIQRSGAFSLVAECIPSELGRRLSQSLEIPVIGIGAGPHCAGQVLVIHDLLGMTPGKKARFVEEYENLFDRASTALSRFASDVRRGAYPDDTHSYH